MNLWDITLDTHISPLGEMIKNSEIDIGMDGFSPSSNQTRQNKRLEPHLRITQTSEWNYSRFPLRLPELIVSVSFFARMRAHT
jgi:hypothetical protein